MRAAERSPAKVRAPPVAASTSAAEDEVLHRVTRVGRARGQRSVHAVLAVARAEHKTFHVQEMIAYVALNFLTPEKITAMNSLVERLAVGIVCCK